MQSLQDKFAVEKSMGEDLREQLESRGDAEARLGDAIKFNVQLAETVDELNAAMATLVCLIPKKRPHIQFARLSHMRWGFCAQTGELGVARQQVETERLETGKARTDAENAQVWSNAWCRQCGQQLSTCLHYNTA